MVTALCCLMVLAVGGLCARLWSMLNELSLIPVQFAADEAEDSHGTWLVHDLRHTFASLLAAEGKELEQIKMWLGHSQIALTADVYTHKYPSVAKKTARRLDKYWVQ